MDQENTPSQGWIVPSEFNRESETLPGHNLFYFQQVAYFETL